MKSVELLRELVIYEVSCSSSFAFVESALLVNTVETVSVV